MDPEVLIILFLILAPLLERLLKAGQKKPPDQTKREIPRREPSRQVPAPRPRVDDEGAASPQSTARREEESAAAILPDELWEILTGERRLPQPVPAPVPDDDESYDESYDEMEPTDEWAEDERPVFAEPLPRSRETIRPREDIAVAREDSRRREGMRPREGLHAAPAYEAPEVVSLEPLAVDDVERHRKFHERVTALTAAPAKSTTRTVFRFTSEEDVRRAIIAAEVLGPPKGLQ